MPTPVSALLHAATMVCSGVFVLVRSSYILEYTPSVLLIILWLAGFTTLISGLIAVVTNDIKRVIALSTMSQLARIISLLMKFRNQTICVKLYLYNNSQITNTFYYTLLYKKYNKYNNYIKSLDIICDKSKLKLDYKKWNIFIISKLVGISEAIRLIFINLLSRFNSFYTPSGYKMNTYPMGGNYYTIQFINFYLNYIFNIFNYNYIPYYTSQYRDNNYNILYKDNYQLFKILNKEEDINNIELRNKIEDELILLNNNNNNEIEEDHNDIKFNQWLAGVIDGDGYFNLSKKGIARLNIIMDARDLCLLHEIKNKYGGHIYNKSKANAYKYQLSTKKGLIKLINGINGEIRNTTRLLQLDKLCNKYNIELLYPKPLTLNNGWYSGMIDSDGSIYLNEKNGQIFISVSQKNIYLLEFLRSIYGGKILPVYGGVEAFRHLIYRKNELFYLIDNYFNKYPLRSKKLNRLNLIKQFYILRTYKSNNNRNVIKYIDWINFKEKWDKYL